MTVELIQSTNKTQVAEQLYRYKNPNSSMDTPNSAYITTDKWFKEWVNTDTEIGFFDWCVKNK